MAKKSVFTSKSNPLSQLLIAGAVLVILVAAVQAVTNVDITNVAPTQLFLVAGVLGILGIYIKDDK